MGRYKTEFFVDVSMVTKASAAKHYSLTVIIILFSSRNIMGQNQKAFENKISDVKATPCL